MSIPPSLHSSRFLKDVFKTPLRSTGQLHTKMFHHLAIPLFPSHPVPISHQHPIEMSIHPSLPPSLHSSRFLKDVFKTPQRSTGQLHTKMFHHLAIPLFPSHPVPISHQHPIEMSIHPSLPPSLHSSRFLKDVFKTPQRSTGQLHTKMFHHLCMP